VGRRAIYRRHQYDVFVHLTTADGNIYSTRRNNEREAREKGVWGRSPQRGPGAEPLVVSRSVGPGVVVWTRVSFGVVVAVVVVSL
jgi:hypothetical protein